MDPPPSEGCEVAGKSGNMSRGCGIMRKMCVAGCVFVSRSLLSTGSPCVSVACEHFLFDFNVESSRHFLSPTCFISHLQCNKSSS